MSRAISIILIVPVFAVFGSTSVAADADPDDGTRMAPSECSMSDDTPVVEAYVQSLSRAWTPPPPGPEFLSSPSSPWPQVAARTRAAAKRLAETQGKAIVPVLKKYGPAAGSEMLVFLTLDELQLREETAELACQWFFAEPRSSVHVLLPASFCSEPTRGAIAGALLKRWAEAEHLVVYRESFADYLSIMGNAETADLLRAYDRKIAERAAGDKKGSGRKSTWMSPEQERQETRATNAFLRAAERITARLALPKAEAARRAKDELLFWQTIWYAPRQSVVGADYRFSASSLVAGGCRISSGFLIEVLDSWDRPAFLNPDAAIEIVRAQRENAAVPAMVRLAKHEPVYRDRVESTLWEIGTPEAEKGLQELDAGPGDEKHTASGERPKADDLRLLGSFWSTIPGTMDVRAASHVWRDVVARSRDSAEELAKRHGKEIVPVLWKYGSAGESHIRALLTLDQLHLHEEAVKMASMRFFAGLPGEAIGMGMGPGGFFVGSPPVDVLLSASLCSEPTRVAIANGLLKRCMEGAPASSDSRELFAGFLAVAGNAETANLLRAYDRQIAEQATTGGKESETKPDEESPARERREAESKSVFLQAAEHITARLALPKEAAARRSRDELLIWQIVECAPHPIWGADYRSLVRSYTEKGYRFSPDFLIGLFESKNRPAFLDPDVATEIVLAQREYAAIPALVGLAKREPKYRERVERALREMGTPEAKKAPQERPEADDTPPVRAYLEALFETWDTRPEPRFWRDVIDRNRVAAVALAKTHGKEIVPVLRKYGSVGESQILAFLTLDQLEFHEEAVELASLWFFADSSSGNVLLSASLCSEPTRIAIANGLLKRWTEEGRSPPGSPKSFAGFLAVVGNAETADLLRAYDRKIAERATAAGKESGTKPDEESPSREPPEATSNSIFLQAAEHITARLALSEEASAGQARAELWIWQIAECAPHPVWGDSYPSLMRPYTGESYRFSADFLIEFFESKDRTTPLDADVAIEIVLAERKYAAIPAMVEFVKREPRYRERVERALRQIGTPEAEKGLQEIDQYHW